MKRFTVKLKARCFMMTLLVFAISAFAVQDLLAQSGDFNSFHKATLIDYYGNEINQKHPKYHTIANTGVSVAAEDSLALVELYFAMQGPTWRNNSGWLTERAVFWVGVHEVTEIEPDYWRVTSIRLPRDNQTEPGFISPHFQNFKWLRTFAVRGAILPEGIPNEIAVPELRHLEISHSRLDGEVPWEALRDNSPRLQNITFNQNRLRGQLPSWLGEEDPNAPPPATGERPALYFNNLNFQLRLDENRFSGPLPANIGNYPLVSLNLDWNQFTGPLPDLSIGPMAQTLASLRFSQNDFEPGPLPVWLVDMEVLSMFNFANTNRTGVIPEWIADIPSLVNIDDIGGQDEIGGEYPQSMRFMTNITSLRISGGEWTGPMPTFFTEWPSLSRVRLRELKHTGPLPNEYSNLTTVPRWQISDTPGITGGIPAVYQVLPVDQFNINNNTGMEVGPFPEWIGTVWSSMRQLQMRGVGLTGELPASFQNLGNLQVIRLSNNPGLTGDVPSNIVTNTTASTVDLSDTGLNITEIPDWLALNPGRSVIGLNGYGIEGPIPDWLVNNANMQVRVTTLSLADNNLSGEIPAAFGNWINIDSLNLANNNLSGEIPAQFTDIGLLRPGVSTLSKLTLSGNEGLTGPFPMAFTGIDDMTVVEFDGTNLCEPDDPAFQAWLDGIEEYANNFFPPLYWSVKTSGIKCSEVTSIEPVEIVKMLHLYQNYPNPFNPATNIKYDLPMDMHVTLSVYSLLGQLVKTLVNDEQTAGTYEIAFDARSLASGTYFYHLQAGDRVMTKTMMLIK